MSVREADHHRRHPVRVGLPIPFHAGRVEDPSDWVQLPQSTLPETPFRSEEPQYCDLTPHGGSSCGWCGFKSHGRLLSVDRCVFSTFTVSGRAGVSIDLPDNWLQWSRYQRTREASVMCISSISCLKIRRHEPAKIPSHIR
jgi:hypothetical protein